MKNSVVREDGVYIANTKFTDMSGEVKYLAVFIYFVKDYMVFIGEPSESSFEFPLDFIQNIQEAKREILADLHNINDEASDCIAKYQVISSKSVNANFRAGRAINEICLTGGIFGGVSFSLERKYGVFMDYMNPERIGPRNFKIISNASLRFCCF